MAATRLRDTREFYLDPEAEGLVAPLHLAFATARAGPTVLDYGCATGNYCLALRDAGFECVGVDVNERYVERARQRGLDARLATPGAPIPLAAASVDTVLLFEVLEHVPEYEFVLSEAKRVARKNVLITVPNCGAVEGLARASVVPDHMLDVDHVNFFTRAQLDTSLAKVFPSYELREEEYRDSALYRFLFPPPVGLALAALARTGVVGRRFSYRLFAEARV
jgi:SAM-dependent methyltransferase